MAFCSSCGNQLEEDSKFCPKCGNPVSANVSSNLNGVNTLSGKTFQTKGKMRLMGGGLDVEISNELGPVGKVSLTGGLRGEIFANFLLANEAGATIMDVVHTKPKHLVSASKNYDVTGADGGKLGQMEIHERKALLTDINGRQFEVKENLEGTIYKITLDGNEVAEIKHHIVSKYFEGQITGDMDVNLLVAFQLYKTLIHAISGADFNQPGFGGVGFGI